MIDTISALLDTGATTSASPSTISSTSNDGFDSALKAAQRAADQKSSDDAQMKEIKEKGFCAYVRDAKIEQLKAELRKKLLGAMGLDEKSLAALPPQSRSAIEEIIQEEIKRSLDKAMANDDKNDPSKLAAGQNIPSDGPKGCVKCPVIPALVWPGGASVL